MTQGDYVTLECSKRLKELGLEPVWKDWDASFDLM